MLDAPITTLEPDEVFVFGSNRDGFHGAGGAGLACRGNAGPDWRSDAQFCAMKDAPVGDPARVGRWAVYGVGRGHQVGLEGQSYAIQTIEWPGRRCSTSRRAIYHQLAELVAFARANPHLRFIVTNLGEGLSGYKWAEMAVVWRELDARCGGLPASFRFVRVAARNGGLT
ncbi:MAG TPA: hypothetical protein VFR37_05350 [Longimicrobium sp.]|nr:hypothetical protein [Longimicrobium sp.]